MLMLERKAAESGGGPQADIILDLTPAIERIERAANSPDPSEFSRVISEIRRSLCREGILVRLTKVSPGEAKIGFGAERRDVCILRRELCRDEHCAQVPVGSSNSSYELATQRR